MVEQRQQRTVKAQDTADLARCDIGVRSSLALTLDFPGAAHAFGNRGALFRVPIYLTADGRTGPDDEAEPVPHRSGEACLVAASRAVLAPALTAVDAPPSAQAGVEGGEEHEPRGQGQHALDPGDADGPGVDWAAQRVEGVRA